MAEAVISRPEGPADRPRLAWLDAAKGIGIILVVYGHQLRAQAMVVRVDPWWFATVQDQIIYAFHMPLFFLLSGLTVEKSLRAMTAWQFGQSRVISLLYPYLLWSAISVVLASLASGYVNHAVSISDIWTLFLKPVYQYWFLYVLLICQLIVFLVSVRTILVAAIGTCCLFFPFYTGNIVFTEIIIFFPFFALGILLSSVVLNADRGFSTFTLFGLAILSIIVFLVIFFFRSTAEAPMRLVDFALGVCGIIAVLAFCLTIAVRSRLLVMLGAASMTIFVLHTIVQTMIRTVLRLIPFLNAPIAELLLCVIGGLFVPIVVLSVASELNLVRLLGLGSPLRRREVVPLGAAADPLSLQLKRDEQ